MNLLSLIQSHVTLRRSGPRWAGPCPKCGGNSKSQKFVYYPDKDNFHCFSCGFNGDAITWLREMDAMSCPDAHEAADRGCSNSGCPAWDKCRLGARANGQQPKKQPAQSLSIPLPEEPRPYVPDSPETPQQKWQQQAAAIIEKAHAKLLESPDQLQYLAGRGLPLEAVQQYRLGYLPENRYPARESWGLPTEKKADGSKKKMFLPEGIVIPFFDTAGQPHRLRIRRNHPRAEDPRYYWVPGSGNDVPVLGNPKSRGVVVIESDLDSLMVLWQCRGLDVCTLTLGTVGAKPKDWAFDVCKKALAILVALDFEPRHNSKTGKPENPGGHASKWWLDQFPRASRWPVPNAKDPGEYYQAGGNIRAWVLAGLPLVFQVDTPEQKETKIDHREPPDYIKGATINGHQYVITTDARAVHRLRRQFPGAVVFTLEETEKLKGLTKEQAESALLYRQRGGRTADFVAHLADDNKQDLDVINRAADIFAGNITQTTPIQPGQYQDLHAPLPDEPAAVQEDINW